MCNAFVELLDSRYLALIGIHTAPTHVEIALLQRTIHPTYTNHYRDCLICPSLIHSLGSSKLVSFVD